MNRNCEVVYAWVKAHGTLVHSERYQHAVIVFYSLENRIVAWTEYYHEHVKESSEGAAQFDFSLPLVGKDIDTLWEELI